ncbi:hypothetical protein [Pseudomonas fluorescens]|uniref:Uncharacterized protein n=1 Tax=Pseudomonas fluorescens TaxID=294 RepID=A0A5E6U6T3_PSEFL|nr:hypothetical protein [Pseudomonas fluorescens]VVM98973.1 hypothetical protein PS655_03230 [Pseudomonas fluorescens]
MITPEEAEALAHTAVEAFINRCGCKSIDDVGNVLMKLVSMTGLALCATQGQEKAVDIIEGVAAHVAKPKYAKAARMERVN